MIVYLKTISESILSLEELIESTFNVFSVNSSYLSFFVLFLSNDFFSYVS